MGEIADWLVDQMVEEGQWFSPCTFRSPYRHYPQKPFIPRQATEVAEEKLAQATSNGNVQELNRGIIKW